MPVAKCRYELHWSLSVSSKAAANSSEVSQQFLDGSFHDSMAGWRMRYSELLCDISGLAVSIYHVTSESGTSV